MTIVEKHRQEMAKKVPAYSVFDPLETSALPGELLASIRREVGEIVDVLLAESLPVGPDARETMAVLLRLGGPEALVGASAWKATIVAARPDRTGMRTALDGFGEWVRATPRPQLATFLEVVPFLAPCLADLGSSGVREILEAAGSMDAPGADRLLRLAGSFGQTRGSIILGACRIGQKALQEGRADIVERLSTVMPSDRVMESRDARRLIPVLAALGETGLRLGKGWAVAMDLVLTLAAQNLSSAFFTVDKLPSALAKLAPETAQAYLEGFLRLTRFTGIRLVGFGLRELPGLYGRYGAERTGAFVRGAAEAAESYGITAGVAFCERRTLAARELLG